MKSLLVVQDPATGAGLFPEALACLGLPAVCLFPASEGQEPVGKTLDDVNLLVLLGGPGSLVDGHESWRWEIDLARNAMARGTPVLGVCFGAQLLSVALGGRVRRGPRRLGWYWTGSSNPAWEPDERFYVNGDYAEPPSSVDIWSEDADGVLAFASGSAVGVQCHPEVTPRMIGAWADHMHIDDPEALARTTTLRAERTDAAARRLIALTVERLGAPHETIQ